MVKELLFFNHFFVVCIILRISECDLVELRWDLLGIRVGKDMN